MRVLLTGATGFIGKSFKEAYGRKYDLYAPTLRELDLTDVAACSKVFKGRRFDAVVHCAGKADSRSDKFVEADNLIMFKNIQYMSILNGVKKLIVVGDYTDFDRSVPLKAVKEEQFGSLIPRDGYGMGRHLVTLLAGKDKISTTLRFFPCFGKNGKVTGGPIMPMINASVKGKSILIERDADTSYIYADDAVKIIAAFLDNDFPKGDYNVCADTVTSLSEIARTVKSLAKKDGKKIEVRVGDGSRGSLTGDNSKLRELLPSFRFTSVRTALTKTYEAVRDKCK